MVLRPKKNNIIQLKRKNRINNQNQPYFLVVFLSYAVILFFI